MADQVNKLSEVINNLEEQASSMQNLTNVLQRIDQLKQDISDVNQEVIKDALANQAAMTDFKKSVDLLNSLSADFDRKHQEVTAQLKQTGSSMDSKLEKITSTMQTDMDAIRKGIDQKITASEQSVVSIMKDELKRTMRESRLVNHLCLECGEPLGMIRRMTGKKYCKVHNSLSEKK